MWKPCRRSLDAAGSSRFFRRGNPLQNMWKLWKPFYPSTPLCKTGCGKWKGGEEAQAFRLRIFLMISSIISFLRGSLCSVLAVCCRAYTTVE